MCYQYHGYEKQLGVILLGRQTHYRLESFDGEWHKLEVTP
jgi:hypothetical protein